MRYKEVTKSDPGDGGRVCTTAHLGKTCVTGRQRLRVSCQATHVFAFVSLPAVGFGLDERSYGVSLEVNRQRLYVT